ATSGIVLVACAQVFTLALLNLNAFSSAAAFSLEALSGLVKWKSAAFYAAALLALFFTKVHPIAIVVAGAIFGIVFL
ncbi:MAG: chromate transporter, partial [Treponema sp.]|nr:chromate transporter [Treponema sp.]